MSERGKYITIEGIDARARNESARHLLIALGTRATGAGGEHSVRGAVEIGALVHWSNEGVGALARCMLAAARNAHTVGTQVAPALESGLHVVHNGSWLSTAAALAEEDGLTREAAVDIGRWSADKLHTPDLGILIDTPVEKQLARISMQFPDTDILDGLASFFGRARQRALDLITEWPNHVIVDGGQWPYEIHEDIRAATHKVIGQDK